MSDKKITILVTANGLNVGKTGVHAYIAEALREKGVLGEVVLAHPEEGYPGPDVIEGVFKGMREKNIKVDVIERQVSPQYLMEYGFGSDGLCDKMSHINAALRGVEVLRNDELGWLRGAIFAEFKRREGWTVAQPDGLCQEVPLPTSRVGAQSVVDLAVEQLDQIKQEQLTEARRTSILLTATHEAAMPTHRRTGAHVETGTFVQAYDVPASPPKPIDPTLTHLGHAAVLGAVMTEARQREQLAKADNSLGPVGEKGIAGCGHTGSAVWGVTTIHEDKGDGNAMTDFSTTRMVSALETQVCHEPAQGGTTTAGKDNGAYNDWVVEQVWPVVTASGEQVGRFEVVAPTAAPARPSPFNGAYAWAVKRGMDLSEKEFLQLLMSPHMPTILPILAMPAPTSGLVDGKDPELNKLLREVFNKINTEG